jgi:glutaredoxin
MSGYIRNLLILFLSLSVAGCAVPKTADMHRDEAQIGETSRQYPQIVIYSVAWCSHCKATKEYLTKDSIPFINRDI